MAVTTPNASGLLNAVAAATAGYEVNHPDHVALYSRRYTLTNLMERHGWEIVEVATYVSVVEGLCRAQGQDAPAGLGGPHGAGHREAAGPLAGHAADGSVVRARSART